MTPSEIIEAAKADGLTLSVADSGELRVRGKREVVSQWASLLRAHKAAIVSSLKPKLEPESESICDRCPAGGWWDGYGPWGMLPGRHCFYDAYYLGKAAKPKRCEEARRNCPKAFQH